MTQLPADKDLVIKSKVWPSDGASDLRSDALPPSGALPKAQPKAQPNAPEEEQNRQTPTNSVSPETTAAAPGDAPGDATGAPVLVVDLDALCRNYRALDTVAGNAVCAGVVKANGYGLGSKQVMEALCGAGCETFFVATLREGLEAREHFPRATIYILNGLVPGAGDSYAAHDLRPVLGSLPEIEEWAHYCADISRPLQAALHIDTGMMRLGLEPADVDIISSYPVIFEAFELSLIMSHLACADEPDNPKNEAQRVLFDQMREKLPAAPASLANSAGVLLGARYHYDLVRPGIALYGGQALAAGDNPMKHVISLHAPILQTRSAAKGSSIGYGARHTLKRDSQVAILPAGYADGVFRNLGACDDTRGLLAFIEGLAAPLLGRVSMDLIAIDVTDIPENYVRRGALVELIGPNQSIDEVAKQANTISYEVLTSLSTRYQRVYNR